MKVDRGELDADYREARGLIMSFGEHYLGLSASACDGYLEIRSR